MGSVCLTRNVLPPSTGMRMLWNASPVTLSASAAQGPPRTSVIRAQGTASFSVSHLPLRRAWSFLPSGKLPFTMPSAQEILVFFFLIFYFEFGKMQEWEQYKGTCALYPHHPLLTFYPICFIICLFSVSLNVYAYIIHNKFFVNL